VKLNRTEEADQVKTADMVLVEDVGPDALPAVCSGLEQNSHRSASMFGGRRWEALGVDACVKLLDATVGGLSDIASVSAAVVMDLNPGNGDVLEAFIKRKLTSKLPLFYFSSPLDHTSVEFITDCRVSSLATECEQGLLTIPGLKIETALPADATQSAPAPPKLQALVYNPETKGVRIPADTARKWGLNEKFGERHRMKQPSTDHAPLPHPPPPHPPHHSRH
jgi:hypothetical protein